ncbi:hypothetical protein HYU09_03910 [Candidatus Woesearchaeota archaeon]|nr:hypothetical protein [Candidatus Woesearchaeota archaeon]
MEDQKPLEIVVTADSGNNVRRAAALIASNKPQDVILGRALAGAAGNDPGVYVIDSKTGQLYPKPQPPPSFPSHQYL